VKSYAKKDQAETEGWTNLVKNQSSNEKIGRSAALDTDPKYAAIGAWNMAIQYLCLVAVKDAEADVAPVFRRT